MNERKSDPEVLTALLAKLQEKVSYASSQPPQLSSSEVTTPQTATPKGVMNKLLRALIFMRLVNGDNNISISNIAVIVILVKLALATQLDFAQVAALLTVVGGYNFKKYIQS